MEVRIAVTHAPREITVDVGDSVKGDDLIEEIRAAMAGESQMLWFTDRRGKRLGVPVDKLAYVEIADSESERRVGFSAL